MNMKRPAMFFEMNLSCHPPVICKSEHKTDREEEKLLLESISRRIQHEPFSNIKYSVSCREAAERYGVEVNRCGTALCPFHNDRHPSLYVADDHFCRLTRT